MLARKGCAQQGLEQELKALVNLGLNVLRVLLLLRGWAPPGISTCAVNPTALRWTSCVCLDFLDADFLDRLYSGSELV